MNFSLSEEQLLLRDTVNRFLEKNYSFDLRQKMIRDRQAMSDDIWQGLADLGLLGVPFSEKDGGFGGGGIETMIIMRALGYHLAIEPYISTVILAGSIIETGGAGWQKKALLPEICKGTTLMAFAHYEEEAGYSLNHVETTAELKGNAWVINGKKSMIFHGPVADKLLVSARTHGKERDEKGVSLFIVDCNDESISGHEYPLYDGSRALDIKLTGVEVGPEAVVGQIDLAMPLVWMAVDKATAALCAEAVGVMERVHEMTLEYLKTREQFGMPIGRFQVLQHKAVDMFVDLEQATSMAILACGSLSRADVIERRKAVVAAKDFIGRAGRKIGQNAIQIHGGMGMTNEMAIGHYFKRLEAIEAIFGNSAHQRRIYSELEAGVPVVVDSVPARKVWRQI